MEETGQKTNVVTMTVAEAWADFCLKYNSLPPNERGRLGMESVVEMARRDAVGKRLRKSGTAYGLGAKRVAGIMAKACERRPDVFPYSGVEVVEVVRWESPK